MLRLVGVAVFGVPVQRAVLSSALPTLEPYRESQELSRFVLLDEVPANAESWFLARCFGELRDAGVRGVVSFADPVPRRAADGTVLAPGHVGIIYQAAGAAYAGRRVRDRNDRTAVTWLAATPPALADGALPGSLSVQARGFNLGTVPLQQAPVTRW